MAKKKQPNVITLKRPKKPEPTNEDICKAEAELRAYVKKTGGFRKDLPAKDMARGKDLMKLLGRKQPQWDLEIIDENWKALI